MPTDNDPTILSLPTVRLEDERSVFFLDVVRWIMAWNLDSSVEQIYIQDLRMVQEIANDSGAVLIANQLSGLDQNIFFTLSEHISKRAFVFIQESTLSRAPFLRWCGGVPLSHESMAKQRRQLHQAHRLLSEDEPTQFWIYPQTTIRPPQMTNLKFGDCGCRLAKHLELPVVPVSIQALHTKTIKPTIYISFGAPLPFDASTLDVEAEVKRGLDNINAFHTGKQKTGFEPLYKRRATVKQSLWRRLLTKFATWKLGDL